MPSGTTIQQFITDLRERKSEIARKFDCVYGHCKNNTVKRAQLVTDLRNWAAGTPPTPATLPDLANYGLGADCPHAPPNHHDPLTGVEKTHICGWPPTDRDKVINAMERALLDTSRDIVFWWDLDDDDFTDTAPSKSIIEPTSAGNPLTQPDPSTDTINVTFLTPRKKVKKAFTALPGNINVGGVGLEV